MPKEEYFVFSLPLLLLSNQLHDEAAAINGIDAMHEILGVKFLRRWFSDDVLEPIRLHVEAKRYAARDPTYFENLAEASLRSLRLQGGVFSDVRIYFCFFLMIVHYGYFLFHIYRY